MLVQFYNKIHDLLIQKLGSVFLCMCKVVTRGTHVYAQYKKTDFFLILQSKQNRLKDSKAMCVDFVSLYIHTYDMHLLWVHILVLNLPSEF